MALVLPNPGSPANGQPLDANPILANQTAIAQSIQLFDGNQIQTGTLSNAAAFVNALNPLTRTNEATLPFVALGCTWSAVSGTQGTMASGIVYINGIRVSVNGIGSYVFTINQDTYVAVDVNANITYSAVSNGAASPTLLANSIWLAKIVTGGGGITSIQQTGVTTLSNAIYPISPIGANSWKIFTSGMTSAGGTLNAASLTGNYSQVGKVVHFRAIANVTNAGTATGSLGFGLPVTSSTGVTNVLIGYGREGSVSGKMGAVFLASNVNASIINYDNTTAIQTGAVIYLNGTYEAA